MAAVSDQMPHESTSDALRNAENTLRDLIDRVMSSKHGPGWQASSDLTGGRCRKWQDKQRRETSIPGTMPEHRLLYYADLGELLDLILSNWECFADCFGDQERFTQMTSLLRQYRNKVLHGRDLLSHERYLILGITGLIRSAVTIHRTRRDSAMAERYFPRLEYLKDSLGNIVGPGIATIVADQLVVGSMVEFAANAFDPMGDQIEYCFYLAEPTGAYLLHRAWGPEATWAWPVTEPHIGSKTVVCIIRSPRPYHLRGKHDDVLLLEYTVIPAEPTGAAA